VTWLAASALRAADGREILGYEIFVYTCERIPESNNMAAAESAGVN
jgi:hypothetical protein